VVAVVGSHYAGALNCPGSGGFRTRPVQTVRARAHPRPGQGPGRGPQSLRENDPDRYLIVGIWPAAAAARCPYRSALAAGIRRAPRRWPAGTAHVSVATPGTTTAVPDRDRLTSLSRPGTPAPANGYRLGAGNGALVPVGGNHCFGAHPAPGGRVVRSPPK
jgi:hypothetical protein